MFHNSSQDLGCLLSNSKFRQNIDPIIFEAFEKQGEGKYQIIRARGGSTEDGRSTFLLSNISKDQSLPLSVGKSRHQWEIFCNFLSQKELKCNPFSLGEVRRVFEATFYLKWDPQLKVMELYPSEGKLIGGGCGNSKYARTSETEDKGIEFHQYVETVSAELLQAARDGSRPKDVETGIQVIKQYLRGQTGNAYDSLLIVDNLIATLSYSDTVGLREGLKLEIAKLIEPLIVCTLLAKKNNLESKQKDLEKSLQSAIDVAQKGSYFVCAIQLLLELSMGAVQMCKIIGPDCKFGLSLLSGVVDRALFQREETELSSLESEKTNFDIDSRIFSNGQWYREILEIDKLRRKKDVKSIQEYLKKELAASEINWVIANSLLEGLHQLIWVFEKEKRGIPESKSIKTHGEKMSHEHFLSSQIAAAFFGTKEKKTLLPGVIETENFEELRFPNDWRVRDRIVRICINLSHHPESRVSQGAKDVLLNRVIQERNSHVRAILENPDNLKERNSFLKEAWEKRKCIVEEMLSKQEELILNLQSDTPANTKEERLELMPINNKQSLLREKQESLANQYQCLSQMLNNLDITAEWVKGISKKADKIHQDIQILRAHHQTPLEILAQLKEKSLQGRELEEVTGAYIPAQGIDRIGSDVYFQLKERVVEFLADGNEKTFLLLGEGGAGKSLFTCYIQKELWKLWKAGGWIPVRIDLPTLQDSKKKMIEETLEREGILLDQIPVWKKNYKFLFLLDGYDELNTFDNLYESNRLNEWNAKILTTCRLSYLKDFPNYNQLFCSISTQGVLEMGTYLEKHMAPFSKDQAFFFLREYIRQASEKEQVLNSAQDYWNVIEQMNLITLTQVPFLLRMMAEVLPFFTEKKENLSELNIEAMQNYLFDLFVERWFFREQAKLLRKGANFSDGRTIERFERFCIDLAIAMTEKKQTCITPKNKEVWDRFFSDSSEEMRIVRKAVPVRFKGSGWAFIHPFIQGYFAAKALQDEVSLVEELSEDDGDFELMQQAFTAAKKRGT